MINDNLLSTKFIYAIVALVSGLVLCALGIVSGEEFFKFAEIIGGSYILGNVVQKFIPQK
jgi:hypothetical protein